MKISTASAGKLTRSFAASALVLALIFPRLLHAREPLPRRLLRTLQIGVPQDLSVGQIRKIAESNDTDYTTEVLARSALLVLQQDEPKLISYQELFDTLLSHLVSDGSPFQPLPGLPSFRAKETVMAMAYAMVMSGGQDRAIDILEKHAFTGSRYKQAAIPARIVS